jgi:hypothetical protein
LRKCLSGKGFYVATHMEMVVAVSAGMLKVSPKPPPLSERENPPEENRSPNRPALASQPLAGSSCERHAALGKGREFVDASDVAQLPSAQPGDMFAEKCTYHSFYSPAPDTGFIGMIKINIEKSAFWAASRFVATSGQSACHEHITPPRLHWVERVKFLLEQSLCFGH